MSQLSITKKYGDLTLLFASDVHDMWTEVEAKINGNIDSDNVQTGWAKWNQVVLEKDQDFDLSTSGIVRFYSSTNEFVFAHDTTSRNTIFKIGGTEIARVDSSANFKVDTNIFFYNRNTNFGLAHLINYQKPVLVYVDSTTIRVEQNTTVANETLIVFPAGPIAVIEDTASTHKFRMLKTSATANGYDSDDTGAADSGVRQGLTLSANTWYFIYAAVVNYGDDAGNKFILVLDDTSPAPSNWATLDTRYGAGMWVYLGLTRRGFGGSQTTTIIPFVQDHQGWHTFTSRCVSGDFFGLRIASGSVSSSSSSGVVIDTFPSGNSGDAVPSTCSLIKATVQTGVDGDGDMMGTLWLTDSSGNVLHYLPSFGNNLTSSETHGWEFKIPNGQDIVLRGRAGTSTGEDFNVDVYIAAVLDEWL